MLFPLMVNKPLLVSLINSNHSVNHYFLQLWISHLVYIPVKKEIEREQSAGLFDRFV